MLKRLDSRLLYGMRTRFHSPAAEAVGKALGKVGEYGAVWLAIGILMAFLDSDNGENWVGIFAAGAIGFVFCVSVYRTGSAWWAIGCHASWDWAETYFYGTADSGLVARGHLLSAAPAGNPLWSGGTDGPEGSLLVLGVIVLLLLAVTRIAPLFGLPASLTGGPWDASFRGSCPRTGH